MKLRLSFRHERPVRHVAVPAVNSSRVVNVSRRRFLFTGVAGALVLATAHWLRPAAALDAAATAPPSLSRATVDILHALIPAFLDGALPTEANERQAAIDDTVAAMAIAIDGLPPITRDELSTLFTLLAFPPIQYVIAGMNGPWRSASLAEADAFLTRLQKSRWSLKRTAYDALHQLTMAAWYANARAWPPIGYPGPPTLR